MQPASYRDIPAEEIALVTLESGARVKIIAGRLEHDGRSSQGPVRGVTTDPTYFDIDLPARADIALPVANDYNAFVYPYEGELIVGPTASEIALRARSAGVLSHGETFAGRAGKEGAKFLLLAAKPIGEPVVQHGPFVMNTQQEIEEAILDLHSGRFVA